MSGKNTGLSVSSLNVGCITFAFEAVPLAVGIREKIARSKRKEMIVERLCILGFFLNQCCRMLLR